MCQSHTWQPLSICHQNPIRGWLESSTVVFLVYLTAWAFCWWREFSSQTLTRNILLPPVQYIRVEEWESWRLSGCCSLVAERWLHAWCPRFDWRWLPAFPLSSNFTSKTSKFYLFLMWGISSKSWSWDFTILSISWWRLVQSDYNQDLFLLSESLTTTITTCTIPQCLLQCDNLWIGCYPNQISN